METETIQTSGALAEAPVQITTRWENPSAFVEESFAPAPPESETDSWATPQEDFDKINREFNFNLDVCASHENHKCKPYFTIEDNALERSWAGRICWANIPFSNPAPWLEKAWHESQNNGATVVVLMKADTSTRHWIQYCLRASEIRYFTRRIKFVRPEGVTLSENNKTANPDFACAVVIFRPPVKIYFDNGLVGTPLLPAPAKTITPTYGYKTEKKKHDFRTRKVQTGMIRVARVTRRQKVSHGA
jgi:phage N-6-adenine-methyltransferase